MIKIDVKIGDTILMGKWKNKKVVIKTISEDEHGMPTINGKKIVTFRIPKTEEVKENKNMKLTESRLRKFIKEEIQQLNDSYNGDIFSHNPDTVEDAKSELRLLLKKKMTVDDAMNKLPFSDDGLWDELDDVKYGSNPNVDVRSIIKRRLEKLGIKLWN